MTDVTHELEGRSGIWSVNFILLWIRLRTNSYTRMGIGVAGRTAAYVVTKIQQVLGTQLLRRVVICIPIYTASYSVKRNSPVW